MKAIRDYPLITALVIKAKTTSAPPMTKELAIGKLAIQIIPSDMIPNFEDTEQYLQSVIDLEGIDLFYQHLICGEVSLPDDAEKTMAYAVRTISCY